MKFIKFSALFLMLVSLSLFFYSCNETTSTGDNPVIDNINPTSGAPGTVVTITGSKFGDYNAATCKVYFNGEKAEISVKGNEIQWFDDEIQAIVPTKATTGNVVVEVDGKQSNGVLFTVPSVAPVTDLMATSKDDKSVSLKWTASADANASDFMGYAIYIYPINGTAPEVPVQLAKGTTSYLATGLTEGTVYNFEVHAVKTYGGNYLLSPKTAIKWSPAARFINNINDETIKVYETSSNFGSGLQLFNEAGGAPKTLKIASHTDWDLGVYTSGNNIWFGSASKMKARYPSSFTGTAKVCQMSAKKYFVTALDEVFDSQALDQGHTFTESEVDLSTLTDNKNVVFVVRTNSPTWNYAKVMLVYKNGSYLQGTAPDRYIEIQVSYQKTPGVPYAF
jgi:hypothetical protein